MKTRVLIADDHPIVRSGIRTELTRHPDFEIVGEAVTADEVIDLVGRIPIDIIILDISMPGIKAAEVIKRIGKESSRYQSLSAHCAWRQRHNHVHVECWCARLRFKGRRP